MSMSLYPRPVQEAATRVVQNQDFLLVAEHHLNALQTAVLEADTTTLSEAHHEFTTFRSFLEELKVLTLNERKEHK
jgi:hypothetical protein